MDNNNLPAFTYRYVIEGEMPAPDRETVLRKILNAVSITAAIAPTMTKMEVDAQPKSRLISPFDTNGVRK